MRIYRALNFRSFIHLVDADLTDQWNRAEGDSSQNWWFSGKYRGLKEEVINHVIQMGTEAIVEESLYFTSLGGGRWNLPKSHGILYCSENPLLSCLEVAYHNLMEGLPYLRQLKNIEDRIRTSINLSVPDEMRFLIVVLVFNLRDDEKLREIDTSLGRVKSVCDNAGFRNYTGSPGFDENFIFGNDYSVTQTIGAMLYGQNSRLIGVRSARTDHPIRLILPTERAFYGGSSPLKLELDYYEFECQVQPLAPTHCHELSIKAKGMTREMEIDIHLDRVRRRPTARSKGVKLYLPSNTRSPKEDGRMVVLQKYHLPSECPFRAGRRS